MKYSESKYIGNSDGYAPGVHDNYVLGINIGVGIADKVLGHDGSHVLDEIDAFDKAEVDEALMGQINMVTVSSFCGLNGSILGYDLFAGDLERLASKFSDRIEVYSVWPLIEVTKSLLGTVDAPRAPFVPGAHVFCATKNYKKHGAGTIYAGIALAIPKKRNKVACLMMEDSGEIPAGVDYGKYEHKIHETLVASVLNIAKNQRVEYEKVFVGIKAKTIAEGQVGCALVASPYIVMPQIVTSYLDNKDIKQTKKGDLDAIFSNK